MANFFDQFDGVETESANFFDQFDESEVVEEPTPTPESNPEMFAIPEVGVLEQNLPPEGGEKSVSDFSTMENVVGAAESAISAATGGTTGMLTGTIGGIAGALGDLAGLLTQEEAQELQRRAAAIGTYEPKTEAGQAQVKAIGDITESLPPVMGPTVPRVRIGKEAKAEVLPEVAQRAERFAAETGAPLLASDLDQPQTFAGKAIRSMAEKVPVAGTGGLRAKQQEARQTGVSSFLEKYDTVSDQDLYNSLMSSQQKNKQAIGKVYDDIGKSMEGATVPPTKTIQAIDTEIERLTKPGVIRDDAVLSDLQTLKEQLSSGEVDYQTMRENRTYVRESLKSDKSQTMSDRVIDRVYSAMTEDIQDSVRANAGEEVVGRLKGVDAQLAKQYNEAKKTKLKNVLSKGDVKPEEVTKMLLSNDRSDNVKLYKELDEPGRNNARAVLVGELSKAYEDTESPEKFLNRAKKLQNQFGVFFRGEEGEALKDLTAYLNQTRQAANAGVLNQNGQQIMSLISAAPAVDVVGTGGLASAAAGGIGLTGRLLESRKVRRALKSVKNTRPYTPEYNQALIALDNAVNEVSEDDQR